jgi:hypothetical protein
MARSVLAALLVTLSAPQLSAAQPASSAKAFVDGIYARHYRDERSPQPPQDQRIFAPELAKLIARDRAIAERNGEPNVIDYDVFCSCQDHQGIKARTRIVSQAGPNASVSARLTFPGMAGGDRTLVYRMAKVGRNWRVADIVGPDGAGSLTAALRKGTR